MSIILMEAARKLFKQGAALDSKEEAAMDPHLRTMLYSLSWVGQVGGIQSPVPCSPPSGSQPAQGMAHVILLQAAVMSSGCTQRMMWACSDLRGEKREAGAEPQMLIGNQSNAFPSHHCSHSPPILHLVADDVVGDAAEDARLDAPLEVDVLLHEPLQPDVEEAGALDGGVLQAGRQ